MVTEVIDKKTSEKIRLIGLLATIFIVVRHSFNAHIYYPNIWETGPQDISSFIQLLGARFTAIAIPTFFVVSGYLFYNNYQSKKDLLRKWKSRIHSLVIPYFTWNVLYYFLFLLIPNVTILSKFSAYEPLTVSLHNVMQKLTIDPIAGHFWYVRDLIGFVVLAPVIYFTYTCRWLAGGILLGLLIYWRPVDRTVLSSEGILFFYIGGWAGFRKLELGHLRIDSLWGRGSIFILWLGLCVYQTLWPLQGIYQELVVKTSTLAGVVVLWLLTDRIDNSLIRGKLLRLAPYAFFIYALHTPMVKYIYKVMLWLAPRSQYYSLLLYIVVSAITISICVATAKFVNRYSGRVYFTLTGGR